MALETQEQENKTAENHGTHKFYLCLFVWHSFFITC